MSKVKFLTILSIALAVINLVLIGFFLSRPHHGKYKDVPKEYIVKQLNLDKKQVLQYDILIEEHQGKRNVLNEKIMMFQNELYPVVLKEGNVAKKDEILIQLNSIHQELETLHLDHFEQLKKICRADQINQFQALVDKLTDLFLAESHKNKD